MNLGGDRVAIASTELGLRLLAATVCQAPGRNTMLSAIGPFQALALLSVLSTDTARHEIRTALRISGICDEPLQEMCSRLPQRITETNGAADLVYATALWAGQDFTPDSALGALCRRWGIELFDGDTVTTGARQEWARLNTRGLLSLPDGGPPSNGADLTNALYFQGEWQNPFKASATQDRPFHRIGLGSKRVPLMRNPEHGGVRLYRSSAFDAARIPYAGDEDGLALHVLLPHRSAIDAMTGRDYLTPFVAQFSMRDLEACQSGYEEAVVDLILPRFRFQSVSDLRSRLMQLGIRDAFDIRSVWKSSVPTISSLLQQSHIAVNEVGTTAAALTMCVLESTGPGDSAPPRPRIQKFYANRPFLFFLTNDACGLVLFAGVVYDPGQ